MIWLLDLDNTLVGRDLAFAAWARGAVADAGGDESDVVAIVAADRGGHAPKTDVARVIVDRLGWTDELPAVVERFRRGILDHVEAYPGVLAALDALRADGHRVVVVTNGTSAQQRGKIARCAVAPHVDAVVVSDEEQVAKPDPRLLEIALERIGAEAVDRREVWMVGDAPHLDVAAGRAAGVRTAWVSHGHAWAGGAEPDVVGTTTIETLALAAATQEAAQVAATGPGAPAPL
ncbi:HAD family hydrolase [Cellulosimicrobium sp. PMB13]|uniref:HAD family hydrolase n=1 Tax=Cellulosimicrobium sp. PMB13 TaxID=3120158 RepID=UPI003F4B5964